PLSPRRLRMMQLTAAGLLVGISIFLFVTLYLVLIQNQGQGLAPPAGLPMMTLLAGLLLVTNVPMAMFVPRTLIENSLKQIAAGTWTGLAGAGRNDAATDGVKLLTLRARSLIVTLALFEGAAFLGLIAFLVEVQVAALAVVAIAVFLMLLNFPTERRVRNW